MFSRFTVIERSPRNSRMLMSSSGNCSLNASCDRTFNILVFFEEPDERAGWRLQAVNGGVDFGCLQLGLPRMPFVGKPRVGFDLLLKFDDGVEDGFGSRRTTGDVDIHRNDFVDALHDVIRAIETAACRACAHRNDPFAVRPSGRRSASAPAPSCR